MNAGRKIAIGSDHGGFQLKNEVIELVEQLSLLAVDVGCFTDEAVDYPALADSVCRKVIDRECSRGILICGTGIGMSIAANRHPAIRAALCYTPELARLAREHNNANVICLGGRFLEDAAAKEIVRTWLSTDFSGGRHQRRIEMLS